MSALRRTGIKRGTTELKRTTELARSGFTQKADGTPRKKRKRSTRKKAKDAAWAACSKYIRLRDALRTTGGVATCICVTCGRVFPTFGKQCIHAGHWLGGRKGKNLFDERGIFGQCFGCNVRGNGQQISYTAFMMDYHGHDIMDELVLQGNTNYTYTIDELEAIKAMYEAKAEELI